LASHLARTLRPTRPLILAIVAFYPIVAASQQLTKPDDTVSLVVTITDKSGRYVGGLNKNQVKVLAEDTPQEISSFEVARVPVSVAFLLDMSALKRAELTKVARAALSRFVSVSNSANDYLIAGIDGDSYSARKFVRDVNSIGSQFDNFANASITKKPNLSDGISLVIDKVKSGANPKQVIVFVSNDDGLKRKLPDLLETVKQSDVILYAIKLKDAIGSNLKSAAFDELSSTSGGKAFYPATDIEFSDTFEVLALEFANQYSLVFKPANPPKGWNRLRVTVEPLQLKENPTAKKTTPVPLFARTRSGYYHRP